MSTTILLGLALLLVPKGLAAAVAGQVTTAEGDAISGARVEAEGSTVVTDDRGRFRFPTLDGPVTVIIQHPRFEVLAVNVESEQEGSAPPSFVLQLKNAVFDEISVSATRGGGSGFEPVSVAATAVTLEDRPTVPTTTVGLIAGTPGVAESGQGGQFQAYSIRGVAGQRVMTLVAGTRIVTERRAGATASFIDPRLLDRAEVVRGPFSSYYGSGALGGLVQLFPRRFEGLTVNTGYESEGDQRFLQIGLGWQDWSLGISYRRANDTETPDGLRLFSRFEQWSAALNRTWEVGEGSTLELTAIPALGRDIGKPNADFPGRTTIYPEENHFITRLVLRTPSQWRFDIWAHPNELLTRDIRSNRRTLVDNDAIDYGLNAQKELAFGSGWNARLGVDYFGRSGVKATEESEDRATGETTFATTLDGRQDELGAYGSLRRTFARVTVEGGGRFTWVEQSNSGAATSSQNAATAFIGMTAPLGAGFELVANVGNGFRFAGLSERFFTGTTGRGEIIANADLDPERSLSVDLGLRYFGSRFYIELFGYRNEIDDYIERIRLDNGARTFVNLTAGTIEGVELSGFYQLRDDLRMTWSAQRSSGEADDGTDLADIPPPRAEVGLTWRHGAWGAGGRYEHRFEKDRIGSGEQVTPAADLVSASLSYRLPVGVDLTLTGNNLLDETYLPSADDLAVPAVGRSLGMAAGWSW